MTKTSKNTARNTARNTTAKLTAGLALALATSTGAAFAGGLDRSGQSVGILFEAGNHAKLSFGYVDPDVTASAPVIGDMAPGYIIPSVGVKFSLTDQLSAAIIYDQPFGASVEYPTGSPYGPVAANVNSHALTALLRYDISDRILVFGGASVQSLSADVAIPAAAYTLDMDPATGFGYVAGAAYQIPEMALRVALTYRSEITSTHDTLEGATVDTMPVTTPQSLNLEFQTGINPKTLIFGSVRWVNWSAFEINPPSYPANPLLSYDNDAITYSLGVGRKLTDKLSVAATVGYERATGGAASVLAPTDGNISLGVGVTYDMGAAKVTAGVRHIWLGDATDTVGGTWDGNRALAAGISVAFDF